MSKFHSINGFLSLIELIVLIVLIVVIYAAHNVHKFFDYPSLPIDDPTFSVAKYPPPKMVCSSCQSTLQLNSIYCMTCGAEVPTQESFQDTDPPKLGKL